ncbi:HEPN domain-containing protein [Stygiolobus azoricus]|uniref:HEPN domain-containing protein n=1 Tax=Stygiolobus azoricus TaxID=41675 RepID=A0A650CPK5_9CREN|nr:HEPN domain-containing protein [Stygiolobus azoricus]QGR19771.1 HEPN domain-containing protein [Stygiolobus azoricus]
MSGNYVRILKERALNALELAKISKDVNWSLFLSEQAAQLYIKAIYYELFGEKIRGQIRGLLGQLITELDNHHFEKESKKIKDFVTQNREKLIILEESYTESRYGEEDLYEPNLAADIIKLVSELIQLLEELSKNVKLG